MTRFEQNCRACSTLRWTVLASRPECEADRVTPWQGLCTGDGDRVAGREGWRSVVPTDLARLRARPPAVARASRACGKLASCSSSSSSRSSVARRAPTAAVCISQGAGGSRRTAAAGDDTPAADRLR
eukprot:scaffold18004_cov89-Isochrysis_galbana.AAC.1